VPGLSFSVRLETSVECRDGMYGSRALVELLTGVFWCLWELSMESRDGEGGVSRCRAAPVAFANVANGPCGVRTCFGGCQSASASLRR